MTRIHHRHLLASLLLATAALRGVASADSGARPAGASISVTIRSACSATVKVRYDDTTASISSNEVDTRTLDVGDQVWVLDDAEQKLGSVTVTESTRELRIESDCRSVSIR